MAPTFDLSTDDVPVREELRVLYEAVGWTVYTADLDALERAVAGSSCVVTARSADGRLLGLARAISDGVSVVLVQDLLVHPDAQRTGVGTALMTELLDIHADIRQKVLLTDDEPGQHAFYRSLGFEAADRWGNGTVRAFVRFD